MWTCPHMSGQCMQLHGHMAGARRARPAGHVWTMWTMQKTIVHMVHMHAPGFSGVGEVWTMWTVWTVVLNRWLITLYTGIVYTLHFLPFLSFYCPHGPQPLFSVARHVDKLWRAHRPQIYPHGPQKCKLIVCIGFWSPYVNQSLTSVGTILPCYIYERVRK
jgi:hypothetical protein